MQCLSKGSVAQARVGAAAANVAVSPVQVVARPVQQQRLLAQQHQLASQQGPAGRALLVCALAAPASSNGAAAPAPAPSGCSKPSPAETARTVIDICQEGTLSTLGADGTPIGTPVAFTLDKKTGQPMVELARDGLEVQNLARDARCSLQVQHTQFPARAVASVTLVGQLRPADVQQQQADTQGALVVPMHVDKALYKGGLDQGGASVEVGVAELLAAEPDVLRKAAEDLIRTWNDERAEDIYRIVSQHMHIPLTEMSYAELLWLDRQGMYVRVEAEGHLPGPSVVRVPFYRPVLDERDVRSVLTMAAQVSWETERPYTPPVPAIFTDAAAAANN